MKTIYSNTISESIQYDEIGGSTSKPFIKTQYYSDTESTWHDFEDVISREIKLSNQNKRYSSFSFVPPTSEINLVLNNFESIYSTGSGHAKASILKKNLKIRCFSGYSLSATGSNSYTDDFSTNCKFVHTQSTSGSIQYNIASYTGTMSKYAFLNPYDKFYYDTRLYSLDGYYHKIYTLSSTAYDSFKSIEATVNNNNCKLKYKVDDLGWTNYVDLNTGANIINIESDSNSNKLEYILAIKKDKNNYDLEYSDVENYWKFDGDGLATVGINGTVTGTPVFVTGYYIQALNVKYGSGGYKFIQAISTPNLFSVGFYIKLNSDTNTNDIFYIKDTGDIGTISMYVIYNDPEQDPNSFTIMGGSSNKYIFSCPSIIDLAWHHVCFCFNGSGNYGEKIRLFVDGEEIGVTLISYDHTWSYSVSADIRIGHSISYPNTDFYIDNVKTYNSIKNDSYVPGLSEINSIKINMQRKGYIFERGTFIIDQPEFDETSVKITGRDYLKKALETEISMPELSSVNIASAITYVFDRCGVPYNISTWDTTAEVITVNSTFAEQLNGISGWKALDYCMDALNAGNDDWRLKTESNGNISLKNIQEASAEADYAINYFYNIESVAKNFDSDKQLQRITVANKEIVTNPEALFKTYIGNTASGNLHCTYGTTAVYVSYRDTYNSIYTENARSNTGIDFSLTGGSAYEIKIYGCHPKNLTTGQVWAERGHGLNTVRNDGMTYKTINPILNQARCTDLANYLINLWGDPAKKVNLSMRSNPYLELNDSVLVLDKYTATDDIYIINQITEKWEDPSLVDNYELTDRGVNLGLFVWDRNGMTEGGDDIQYDTGFSWDQDIFLLSSDDTDYSFLKPTREA